MPSATPASPRSWNACSTSSTSRPLRATASAGVLIHPSQGGGGAARTMAKKTQIVVVGGGAGGLELVTKLGARFGRRRHDIILVERNRTHIWKPLLHEVAAGSLDASLDEVGYRSHCHRWGYRFFMGALQGIDRATREIVLAPIVEEDGG